MSLKKQKTRDVDEQDLRYIAEYSAMREYDLMDYIESHLVPRSGTAGFDEAFHFMNEMFKLLKNRFF